jgi:hypothetical protein
LVVVVVMVIVVMVVGMVMTPTISAEYFLIYLWSSVRTRY